MVTVNFSVDILVVSANSLFFLIGYRGEVLNITYRKCMTTTMQMKFDEANRNY
jgi:hypothetical protein